MSKMQALHHIAHRALFVDPQKVESVGARERMVPVVRSEFLKLAVQYPILVTKNEESGRFLCVALLGFDPQENLFWENDRWDGIYTPLNIMRQPFFVGVDKAQDNQVAMCIDIESPCISDARGERIFDDEGRETDLLGRAKAMLAQLVEGEADTQTFLDTLVKYDLLTPLRLELTLANQEKRTLQGLYSIDEEKLAALDDASLLQLQRQGFMKSMYIMVTSLSHIYSLLQRKNARL